MASSTAAEVYGFDLDALRPVAERCGPTLDELVTTSPEEYEALALWLALDRKALAGLRARLAENRRTYPLFDTERSTRNLEAAYRRMCEMRRAGLPPAAFSVSGLADASR